MKKFIHDISTFLVLKMAPDEIDIFTNFSKSLIDKIVLNKKNESIEKSYFGIEDPLVSA